jgi:hypothetical protein
VLRIEVIDLRKNIEEASTSSVKIVEEKCNMSLEGKSEENPKSYAEVKKGSINK